MKQKATAMKVTLLDAKVTSWSSNEKSKGWGLRKTSVAYLESNLSEHLDNDLFDVLRIRSLNFKCKAWSKAVSASSKIQAKNIKELLQLPEATKVVYSSKAGCSCGCSPGYVISNIPLDHKCRTHQAHIKMVYNDEEAKWYAESFKKSIQDEIAQHDQAQ